MTSTDTTGTQYSNGTPVTLNAGITFEIAVESGVQLKVRACKTDLSPFGSDVYVQFYEWYTHFALQMFGATLTKNGTSCTNYGSMTNETTFSTNQGLGGEWQLVSPTTSNSDWQVGPANCTKNVSSPSGTCWSGNTGVITRTCL